MDVRRLECGQPRILQASVRQWSVRVACISRHRSFQSLEGFEDSCAYWHIVVLFVLILTVSFDVNSLPSAISTSTPPGPHDLPSAATHPGCDSNDTDEGPRGLVELDHPRLPRRSQRYNAELRQIMTFSDASKAFKTLPLNAQASMLKDLTPVRGEVEKVSKDASSYELFLSRGNSLLRKVMEALETQPSQDDATI